MDICTLYTCSDASHTTATVFGFELRCRVVKYDCVDPTMPLKRCYGRGHALFESLCSSSNEGVKDDLSIRLSC